MANTMTANPVGITISDYASIKKMTDEFFEAHKDSKFPLSATNEDGENVVIGQGTNEDGERYYELTTYQNNGYIRTNWYYENGTAEETFEFGGRD